MAIKIRANPLFAMDQKEQVEDRPSWWIDSQKRLEEEMAIVFDVYGKRLPTETLLEWQTELRGGECILCGTHYRQKHALAYHAIKDKEGKEVERGPVFGDFTYWVPNCNCYKTCIRTGRMIEVYTKEGGVVKRMERVVGCGRIQVAEALFRHNGVEQRTCLGCGGVIL